MFEELFATRGLSLDRLRTFLDVIAAGGIAKAAPDNLTRQTQYSRQISELSEFFGVQLVRRKGRGIEPTEAGKELARAIREQFASLSDFQAGCRGQPLRVTIGAGDSVLCWAVIPALAAVRADAQAPTFELRNLRSAQMRDGLDGMELDFAVMRRDAAGPSHRAKPLGLLRYVIFSHARLVKGKPKSAIDIVGNLPMAVLHQDTALHRDIERLWSKLGVAPAATLVCESLIHAARAVRAGTHAAVLPLGAKHDFHPDDIIAIGADELKPLARQLCLVWNRRTESIRPPVARLREPLAQAIRKQLC